MPITKLSVRVRSSALILGAAATIGLSACGGDDDDKGASKADYQKSLNAFCGNLTAKQKSLQADVEKVMSGNDPAAQAAAMASFLADYGETLSAERKKLEETGVPAEYEQFDEELATGIAEMAKISTTTAEKVKAVDLSGAAEGDTSGLTELQTALGELSKQENPLKELKAPADLEKATPNCADLTD